MSCRCIHKHRYKESVKYSKCKLAGNLLEYDLTQANYYLNKCHFKRKCKKTQDNTKN